MSTQRAPEPSGILNFEWFTGKPSPPRSYYVNEKRHPPLKQEVAVRLMALDDDLFSAQVSLVSFLELIYDKDSAEYEGPELAFWIASQRHHAKAFICSMHRVGEVLRSFTSRKLAIPNLVRQVAAYEWKRRRDMFDKYRLVRNAVEHLDREFNGKQHFRVLNIVGEDPHFGLQVTEAIRADVTFCAFDSALEARTAIRRAFRQHRKRRWG